MPDDPERLNQDEQLLAAYTPKPRLHRSKRKGRPATRRELIISAAGLIVFFAWAASLLAATTAAAGVPAGDAQWYIGSIIATGIVCIAAIAAVIWAAKRGRTGTGPRRLAWICVVVAILMCNAGHLVSNPPLTGLIFGSVFYFPMTLAVVGILSRRAFRVRRRA